MTNTPTSGGPLPAGQAPASGPQPDSGPRPGPGGIGRGLRALGRFFRAIGRTVGQGFLAAGIWGARLWDTRLGPWLDRVAGAFIRFLDWFGAILAAIGRAFLAVCRFVGRPLGKLLSPVGRAASPLGRLLAPVFAPVARVLRALRTRVRPVWGRFVLSLQMSLHGITAKPLRSALTILGVTIGVASVVSLMGVGEGARQAVIDQFKSLGTNVIVIRSEDESMTFQADDAEELVDRVASLSYATPVVQAKATIKWRRSRGQADLLGVNADFPTIRDHPLAAGHFFSDYHVVQRSPVAVLGYNVAVSLMNGRSPVGQTFTMGGQTFRIIGVLAPKGAGGGDGIDDKILIPYTTAFQVASTRTVSEIWAKARTPEEADLAVVQLGRIFRRQLGLDQSAPTPVPDGGDGGSPEGPVKPIEPGMGMGSAGGGISAGADGGLGGLSSGKTLITITNLNSLVKQADKANRVMTLLLGGIAAVSLLVGGLGIMNIMLVAVTERTEEIGVRRALGAKQGDLITQFMFEALLLSVLGALAGIAVGVWGAGLFGRWGLDTAISFQAVIVAAGVAVGTGLLFGVYPAYAASSVPPVEALRR